MVSNTGGTGELMDVYVIKTNLFLITSGVVVAVVTGV
jgi:hypothetical protein